MICLQRAKPNASTSRDSAKKSQKDWIKLSMLYCPCITDVITKMLRSKQSNSESFTEMSQGKGEKQQEHWGILRRAEEGNRVQKLYFIMWSISGL